MTEWCVNHNLLLNVEKTKEVLFDFRKRCNVVDQVCINNVGVKIVNNYKYLGTIIQMILNGLIILMNKLRRQIKGSSS